MNFFKLLSNKYLPILHKLQIWENREHFLYFSSTAVTNGHEFDDLNQIIFPEPWSPQIWNQGVISRATFLRAPESRCGSLGFGSKCSLIWASLVAQRLKRLPAMRETWVRSLDREDSPGEDLATHSSILAWRIPRTEEPGGLQSMGSPRVGHDWFAAAAATPVST